MPSTLTEHLENLKKLLIEIECSRTDVSESDTRESLINPLIKVLGWSFDLKSVRSKFEIAGCDEPIDYAFFTEFDQNRPALLLVAKKLGSNLNDRRLVQDLCRTLGALGVRYGCLTDGGRYIVYSSRGSDTSEHRQIMDLDIRAMDTVDGLSKEELEQGLVDHLSRQALQDQEKCQGTEQNYKNASIAAVLKSLLSEPFDTAVIAVQREQDGRRVGSPIGFRVTRTELQAHISRIPDEDGNTDINPPTETATASDAAPDGSAKPAREKEETGEKAAEAPPLSKIG